MRKDSDVYIVYAIRGREMATLSVFTDKKKCQSFIKSLQPFTCEIRIAKFIDCNTDMSRFPDWYSEKEFLGA